MNALRWFVAAALSALACRFAVQHATPIDAALPLIAVAVTLLAAVSYPSVMLGVPLLIAAEIAIVDETTRLLAFGLIVAAAAVPALWKAAPRASHAGPVVAAVAVVLLRWSGVADVPIARELFILAVAVATVYVLHRTPLAVAIAVVAALVTPAVPLRTLALPLAVLAVAVLARAFGMPRVAWTWPSAFVVAFVLSFFAWSGVVARAFPYFLQRASPAQLREEVRQALPANATLEWPVPQGATTLVVSGANVAGLRRGTLLGVIQPGNIAVRIGDAADWGYTRRDHSFGARNPLPRDPAGRIRGHGYAAWLDGAGRVALPQGTTSIRITADRNLPDGASLQIEGFE